LRVLLAGFDHNAGSNWSLRDCNSPVRQAIANNYGDFFENDCSAAAGDATGGVCTQIRHVFRPDDFSDTAQTLVGLLNLPSIVLPETTVPNCTGVAPNPAVCTSIVQHTGASPFCNAVRPNFSISSTAATACMLGSDATHDPTSVLLTGAPPAPTATAPGLFCSVGGPGVCLIAGAVCNTTGTCMSCTTENTVYRSTMQDNDPIRRLCFGSGTSPPGALPSEDVCSHSGDLGLVLPMNDIPETGDVVTMSDPLRYNATPCHVGFFASATAPEVYDAMTQARWSCARGLLCPNGDRCNNLGGCIVPADTNYNPQCLAAKTNAPANTASSIAVPIVNPRGPFIAEGRAYNQHLFKLLGTAGAYQKNGFSTPLPMTGAFFRLHTNHSLNPASAPSNPMTCQFPTMSEQIGCLVTANPCSLGTADVSTLTNLNTGAIKVNHQSPVAACIASGQYPL
jgi:hypothetical protein